MTMTFVLPKTVYKAAAPVAITALFAPVLISSNDQHGQHTELYLPVSNAPDQPQTCGIAG
jgi:hypothetical protein